MTEVTGMAYHVSPYIEMVRAYSDGSDMPVRACAMFIDSFWSAFLGAIVVSLVNVLLSWFVGRPG